MKNIFITLFTLLLFSYTNEKGKNNSVETTPEKTNELAQITEPVNQTLDELGASLILHLKNNDFEKFTELLPVTEDVEQIAMNYTGPEEKKKKILLSMQDKVKEIMINSKTGFDEVFNSALKEGVVWNDVNFSHVEYDIKKKDNIERASMTIFFVYSNLNYKIYIGESVNSQRGWLVTQNPEWGKLD